MSADRIDFERGIVFSLRVIVVWKPAREHVLSFRTLPARYYTDPGVFREEIENFYFGRWICAGRATSIPNTGDYFTLEVGPDSIAIVRGADAGIRGFHNVCRHRGSLICTETTGHAKKFICPYHQWTYGLDGKLIACRGMGDDFDKSQFSLKQVAVHELEGLIYFSLAKNPWDTQRAREIISTLARPQGFATAKVADAEAETKAVCVTGQLRCEHFV